MSFNPQRPSSAKSTSSSDSSARKALRQKGLYSFNPEVEKLVKASTCFNTFQRPTSAKSTSSSSNNNYNNTNAAASTSRPNTPAAASGFGYNNANSSVSRSATPSIGELRGTTDIGRDAAWRTSTIRPSLGGGLESHKAFLAEACERASSEAAVFTSFSTCCENILGEVKASYAAGLQHQREQYRKQQEILEREKREQEELERKEKERFLEHQKKLQEKKRKKRLKQQRKLQKQQQGETDAVTSSDSENDEENNNTNNKKGDNNTNNEDDDDHGDKTFLTFSSASRKRKQDAANTTTTTTTSTSDSNNAKQNQTNRIPLIPIEPPPEDQFPSKLTIVTATMLLFKLSFVLQSYGPLIRTLINEVLRGVFENYEYPAEIGVGSQFVLKEDHPEINEVDCGFLLQLPVFFDEIVRARARANAALRSSEQVRLSLMAAAAVAWKMVDRVIKEQKRQHFVAWRKTTRRLIQSREAIAQIGARSQRRKLLRKAFLSWRLGIGLSREQRMLELSARNSERLTARARELQQRIELREAELNRQRNLKESYILKSERLEEMMNSLREDIVRVRAKLMDAESKTRASFEVSTGLVKRLELSHINRTASGPLAQLELDGEISSRRIIPRGMSEKQAKDIFTNIAAVMESKPWKVGNPQGFLVSWVNDVLDHIAVGPLAERQNVFSTSSASGATGCSRISSLVPDLCNGRVYTAVFNYLKIAPKIMNVEFESEGERRAAIVLAANEEGIDCLLRPEDLAKEDELPHMTLCVALFARYCNQHALAHATKQDDIASLPELMERSETLLRSVTQNKRWSEIHQILSSTTSGITVQRCFGVVKGSSMTGLSGFTSINATTIKTLRPPAMKFSEDSLEDDQRCERISIMMQACLNALRGIVLDAFFYYASHVASDSLDPYTLDRASWRKILGENKLLHYKNKAQFQELLLDLFDHPGFPLLSSLSPTPSSMILNIEDWLVAIVRIFFAKVEIMKTSVAGVDHLSNLFRTFVVEHICKHVHTLRHVDFVAEFGTPELQTMFRKYRDPLRKVFAELTQAPPHRFRLDMFVHLATRLKVPLEPEVELPHTFSSVRIALTDRSNIAASRADNNATSRAENVGNVRGVDFNGFCALVYVLSQAKMGGNPFSLKGHVLEQFLTTCFFVHFQGRVPLLRW